MAHSREVRLPFLNHELVEFVFALPSSFKIKEGFTKWILRKSMESILPAGSTWTPGKTGYEPPQRQWMQQPVIQEMIREARKVLVNKFVLQADILQQKLQPQQAHDRNNFDWWCLNAAELFRV